MSAPRLKLLVGSWHMLKQVMAFGNPTAGGFETMDEALRAIAVLNKELEVSHGITIAVSGHLFHEIIVPDGLTDLTFNTGWNKTRGIVFQTWMDGIKAGYYPQIGRIIPPGFGFPGSDNGAFINPNSAVQKFAHDMMVYSFQCSEYILSHPKFGDGNVIYWTGPDGIRWQRLVDGDDVFLGHDLNPELEEWKLIVNGVGDAVKAAREAGYTRTTLLIEGKPGGDPCYLDVFTDTVLEIKGIKAINEAVGARVAEWQGEFCHSRGGGQMFVDAMQQAINGGVFGGRIHLNSGGLGATSFSDLLSVTGGTPISCFQQYVDNDFLPGEGVDEWVDDQIATIELGAKWSAENGLPFEVEFDARFSRYPDTIGKLKKSAEWTIDQFNKAAADLS